MKKQLIGILACFAMAACGASPGDPASEDELTGTTGVERPISFEGYVDVDPTAGDSDIRAEIARQVKTALGALRAPKVSLDDRAAQHNVDPSKWTRTLVDVVDPSNPAAVQRQVLRVTYPYSDRAVVTKTLSGKSAVAFTLLFGDYAAHDADLKSSCSDDPSTETDSLWYHFAPELASCQQKIQAELAQISAQRQKIGAGAKIGPAEAGRWFLPITAKLGPAKNPAQSFSPEYDRLFGAGTNKDKVLVYAFFGVDSDETNPDDVLAGEAARFLRTMLAGQPSFRPVHTDPFAYLLDVYQSGQKVPNVTYDQLLGWILDANAPMELRKQALAKLAERWIYWDLPVEVTYPGGEKRTVTIEVRSFFGYEDGSPDARQHAEWRYLEAFWYGDVFLYNGHSHFGHGPLEPTLYGPQNFNDRYQIMLVNSCISYNYYHEDFFAMKPGGTKNLDMVVNGTPSWVWGGGAATASFLLGLIGGKQPAYVDLLGAMRLDMPWGEKAYDPMRVADGELDNAFSQAKTPMAVVPLAPVYP